MTSDGINFCYHERHEKGGIICCLFIGWLQFICALLGGMCPVKMASQQCHPTIDFVTENIEDRVINYGSETESAGVALS